MKPETDSASRRHVPVLLKEVIEILQPQPGQIIVDCTVGLGGHSAELLRLVTPGGKLIGTDLDPCNLETARTKLEAVGGDFVLHHGNFAGLAEFLGGAAADAVLADLGISSPHVDNSERGFSYLREGPLDMRMDPSRGEPASALIHRMGEEELADAFWELGDESDSRKIARLIVETRRAKPIRTTQDLVEIVCRARRFTLQRARGAKLHPAARTFQALRILVNREMANLDRLLTILPQLLKPGGRAAMISFHSGEDRRVKQAFREGVRTGVYAETSRKVIRPTPEEIRQNRRSSPAKLRWAIRAS